MSHKPILKLWLQLIGSTKNEIAHRLCRLSRRQDDGTKPPLGSRFCLWHHLSSCFFQAWDCEGPAWLGHDWDMLQIWSWDKNSRVQLTLADQEFLLPKIVQVLPKCQKHRFSTRWVSYGVIVSACEANIQEHQLHALKQGGKHGQEIGQHDPWWLVGNNGETGWRIHL